MSRLTYRFELDATVLLTEAEMSLHLAMIALEGLFGQAGVRLDARYRLDEPAHAIVVDGSTPLGESLVRVFIALLAREFGDESFEVRRTELAATNDPGEPTPSSPSTAAAMAV